MGLPITAEDPLVVEVTEESWNAYSLRDEPTERDKWLFSLLVEMGGIAEGTEPGTWHFNAVGLNDQATVVSLEPVPD